MKNLIAFLLCLGIALALPGVALAQKVGSLTVVQGTVDLLPGGKAAHAAKLGETVQVGDTVRTRKEGRAEITFDDGTIVRVARSTELAITRFLINDKQTDARINLPRGKIQSIVPRKVGQIFGQQEANRFEVKTPTATCGVRGTDFFTYHQNGLSGATFKEGQGYFFNNKMPDLVSLVSAGQSVTITGPDGKPVVRPATENEMQGHGADTGGGGGGSSSGDSGDDTGLGYTPPPPTDDTPPTPPTPPVVGPPINVYIPPTPDPEPGDDGPTDVVVDYGVDHALAVTLVPNGDVYDQNTTLRLTPHPSTTSFDYTLSEAGELLASGTATSAIDLPVAANTLYTLTTTHEGTTDSPPDFTVQNYSLSGMASIHFDGDSWGWSGEAVGGMAVAPGYAFGGWDIILTPSAEGTPNESWYLAAGGQLGNDADSGYWIMEAGGSDTSGISALTYLTEGYLGLGLGTATATFDPQTGEVRVEDIAVGTVAHTPLAFGGETRGDMTYFDASNGFFSYPGFYSGLFGTTHTTLFSGEATPVVMMGQASLPLGNPDQAVLVRGSFDSTERSYDAGVTNGYVAGIWRNNHFLGRVASLYLDADGNIGYLTGAVDGPTYLLNPDGTTMWLATGDLTANVHQPTSGLTTFSTDSSTVEGGGLLSADNMNADGNPIISVQALEGEYIFVVDPDDPYGLPLEEAGRVWTMNMGGTYLGPVAENWKMHVGGSGDDVIGYDGGGNPIWDHYYWLGRLDGTQWGGTSEETENDLAAAVTTRMLSQTYLYTLAGDVLGTFDANNGWQAVGIGTQTSATPLAMSGKIEAATEVYNPVLDSFLYPGPEWGLSADAGGYLDYYEDVSGLLGTTESPWYMDQWEDWQTRPVEAVLMGEYSASDPIDTPYLWHDVTYSYDVTTGSNTTFDLDGNGAGAFGGYVAGSWRNGDINGYLAAIYLDPDGNAGVLVGDLLGSYFPATTSSSMFEADGTLTPVPLATGITIAPADFYNELQANTNPTLTATVDGQFIQTDTDGTILDSQGTLTATQMAGWRQGIPGQDWGLLMLILDGTTGYNPNPDYSYTEWGAVISGSALNINGDPNFRYEAIASGTAVIESGAAYGDIVGTLAGGWVDIDRATTGVVGGKIAGSFDPTNLSWQAVALGVNIETGKFLEMTATETGRAQLTALSIPNIEVGRADLSGSNAVFTEAHMNDVTFFAYRSGEMPKIWASGNVGGTVASDPTGQSVALSGLGGLISANLNMQSWNTVDNKWAATVTGGQASQLLKDGSPVNVNVNFHGDAAGQIAGSDFSGTGSGVVTPVN